MAAVRGCPAVVYDLDRFVEEQPGGEAAAEGNLAGKNSAPKARELSWLGRSFRVAEQFVLARAAAVVTHSAMVRRGALQRGVQEKNLYTIPPPLSPELLAGLQSPAHFFAAASASRKLADDDGLNFLAADMRMDQRPEDAAGLAEELVRLLEGFVLCRNEVENARLFLPAAASMVAGLLEKARALGIAGAVHAVPLDDCERVLAAADVVIAGDLSSELRRNPQRDSQPIEESASSNNVCDSESAPADQEPVLPPGWKSGQNFELRTTAMQALLRGIPLLAADCPENRDISPHGAAD